MSFVPIRTKTLIPDININFNIYINICGKFLLYTRNGDSIESERLKKLKTKKMKQLFISAKDEKSYQNFLDFCLENVAISDFNSQEKAEFASQVSQDAMNDFTQDPENQENYKFLEKSAKNILQVIGKGEKVLNSYIEDVQASDISEHIKLSLATASHVSCLCEELKLDEDSSNNIIMAALLMDIGMFKMPRKFHPFFLTSKENIPKEDLSEYKKHPEYSAEMLSGKEYVNKQIITLVKNHEERKTGNGFPTGTKNVSLENQIISLCETFVKSIRIEKKNQSEAIEYLKIHQLGNFDLSLVKALPMALKKQGIS